MIYTSFGGFKTVAQLLSNSDNQFFFINLLFRIRMGEDIILNVGEIKNALEDLAYTKVKITFKNMSKLLVINLF